MGVIQKNCRRLFHLNKPHVCICAWASCSQAGYVAEILPSSVALFSRSPAVASGLSDDRQVLVSPSQAAGSAGPARTAAFVCGCLSLSRLGHGFTSPTLEISLAPSSRSSAGWEASPGPALLLCLGWDGSNRCPELQRGVRGLRPKWGGRDDSPPLRGKADTLLVRGRAAPNPRAGKSKPGVANKALWDAKSRKI